MNLFKSLGPRSRMGAALIVGAGVLVVGGLALNPLTTIRTSAPPAASAPAATRLASIPVEGMICLSCAATIKSKVKSLAGVQDAEVHFREKVVVVNYRADHPDVPTRAVAAINSLGYKARPATNV